MTPVSPLLLLTLSASLFPPALALFLYARRGRPTGNHPHCAHCNYNLTGLPTACGTSVPLHQSAARGTSVPPSSSLPKCPECGADLTAEGAIRTGARRARPALLQGSATLLGVATAFLAFTLLTFPYATYWRANAPVPFLRLQARLFPAARAWVLDTLARRLPNETDDETAARMLDDLLTAQADPSVAWTATYTSAFIIARQTRPTVVTRDRWNRFVAQSIDSPAFHTRPKIRQGDPIPIELTGQDRGNLNSMSFLTFCRLTAAFDHEPQLTDQHWSLGLPANSNTFRAFSADYHVPLNLPPGPHTLYCAATWAEGRYTNSGVEELTPHSEFRAALPVEILPKDAPLGTPIPAPGFAPTIAAAMDLSVSANDAGIFAIVHPLPAPADRAFTIYARDPRNGRDYAVGALLARANQPGADPAGYTMFHVPIPAPNPPDFHTLTLILRPDPKPLAQSLDQDHYWPGPDILYPDIPFDSRDAFNFHTHRPTPTTQPYQLVLNPSAPQ